MKKTLLTLLALVVAMCVADAKVLTPEESLAKALGCMQNGGKQAKTRAMQARCAVLEKTEKSADNTPLCYVFRTTDGGYIITGADDRAASVLGYVDDCSYEESMQIPAFREWMENCKDAMTWLSRQEEVIAKSTAKKTAEATDLAEAVEPLLGDVMWGQSPIYNDMCPMDANTNERTLTGCVATAMAQIMRYWKWPSSGEGEHYNENYETQYVNFEQSTYNWDKMLDTYQGTDIPEENKTEIAKLMYDLGCALDMNYSSVNSGATRYSPFVALPTYFKYSTAIRQCMREFYTADEWDNLLKSELSAKRPFMMQAFTGVGDGHAFVIDGYNEEGLFHVNWGWNGKSDSYFNLEYMDPKYQGDGGSTGGYYVGQIVTLNIMPNTIAAEPEPNLHIVGPIQYSRATGDVDIVMMNDTYADMSGKAVAAIVDADGKLVTTGKVWSLEGIKELAKVNLGFNVTNFQAEEGYEIIPYYQVTGQSSLSVIPSAQSLDNKIVYHNGVWQYANAPYPEIVAVDTIQAYKCCEPKLRITYKCPESRTKELNTVASAIINKNNQNYCYGLAQLHMKPGETQTVEIPCAQNMELKVADLKEDRYAILYGVHYNGVGSNVIFFDTDSITLNDQVVYVQDKKIIMDKTEYAPGDSVHATAIFVNPGGVIEGWYTFMMIDATGKGVQSAEKQSFEKGETKTVVFDLKAPTTSGEYACLIYNGYASIATPILIDVVESTGISDINVNDDRMDGVMKCIVDGHLVIKKNSKTYTPAGGQIK